MDCVDQADQRQVVFGMGPQIETLRHDKGHDLLGTGCRRTQGVARGTWHVAGAWLMVDGLVDLVALVIRSCQVVIDAGAAIRLKRLERFGGELLTTSGVYAEAQSGKLVGKTKKRVLIVRDNHFEQRFSWSKWKQKDLQSSLPCT